jgi:uncharacterized protein YndB with AHSA1/START domain
VVVNVCPAAVTVASPDRVWNVLAAPDRFGEWVDATFVRAEPPGSARAGQRIVMSAPSLGRRWPVTIEVEGLDPQRRWIQLLVHLPFGVTNQERVTLTETEAGGTLLRFN